MALRTTTNAGVRRFFDKVADGYDRQIGMCERFLFPSGRQWAVDHARGRVVEIAVGTGLNLPLYPEDVTVVGVELSERMLRLARQRVVAEGLSERVELFQGDVQELDLPDASADTVVSTFTICTIPDPVAALREVHRVLRPGGRCVLVEHGPSDNALVRAGMRLAEHGTARFLADNLTRDPVPLLERAGFRITSVSRAKAGVAFHVLAERP